MSRIGDVKRFHGGTEPQGRWQCHEDPLEDRAISAVGLRQKVAVGEERGADAKAQMTVDGSAAPVTALMLAAYQGVDSVVPLLLGAGADRDARNREGKTALMLAIEQDH